MLSKETIEQLKESHSDAELMLVDGLEEDVVIKAPGRPAYQRFMTTSADAKRRDQAADNLLADCLVYPDQATWDSLLERKPGYRETLLGVILEAAGVVQDAKAKKL